MATTTKSGGIRKGAGRKATPIDLKELEILCALHSTDRELADRFGVSVRTLHNRRKEVEFGEVMRRGRARGCGNVRNAQMKLVSAGNPAMCIWLGKNMLGQTGAPSARIAIPKIRTVTDYGVAADKVLQSAACGKITPAHGKDMMNILVSHSTATANGLMSRVEKLEQNTAAAPANGIAVVGSPGEERHNESDREAGKPKMSKEDVSRRVERLENIRADAVAARSHDAVEKSAMEKVRAYEIKHGIEQLPGESQADAIARSMGISSMELKEQMRRRCPGPEETDLPDRSGRRGARGFSRR